MSRRLSNMELLRIVAMLFILVVHADFKALGAPTLDDMEASPLLSFFRLLGQSMSIVCVNLFILISGWFGIRPKIARFSEFVFQVLFFGISIYLVMYAFGLVTEWSKYDWIKLLFFRRGDSLWFVTSYIVLYIFSPILNEFAEHANRQVFKRVLMSFFIVQLFFGHIDSDDFFAKGYSPISFMGLYLLAKYSHLYPSKYTSLNKYYDICIYLSIVFTIVLLAFLFKIATGKGISFLYDYSSPLVILASFYFFLFFTKISFYNKVINWIGASSFAVYLLHSDPLLFKTYYLDNIYEWYTNESLSNFLLQTSGFLICIFSLSILFDKIRLYTWNLLYCILEQDWKKREKKTKQA